MVRILQTLCAVSLLGADDGRATPPDSVTELIARIDVVRRHVISPEDAQYLRWRLVKPLVRGEMRARLQGLADECETTDDRLEILCEIAIQEAALGRKAKARESARRAVELACKDSPAVSLQRNVLATEARAGDAGAGVDRVQELCAGRPTDLFRHLAVIAPAQAKSGDLSGALAICRRLQSLPRNSEGVVAVLEVSAVARSQDAIAANEAFKLARRFADSLGSPDEACRAQAALAHAFARQGDFKGAWDCIRVGRSFRAAGHGTWRDVCERESARVYLDDVAGAREFLTKADPTVELVPRWPVLLAEHCMRAGKLAQVQDLAGLLKSNEARYDRQVVLHRLIVALADAGRTDEALKVYSRLNWSDLGVSPHLNPLGAGTIEAVCRALVAHGDRRRAYSLAQEFEADAELDIRFAAGLIGILDGTVTARPDVKD